MERPGEERSQRVAHALHLVQLDLLGGVEVLFQHGDCAVHRGEQQLVARQNRTELSWRGATENTEGLRERVKNALGVS